MDTMTSSGSLMNSSFSSHSENFLDEYDEVQENKFYDEDSHLRLSEILSEDIGVRVETS